MTIDTLTTIGIVAVPLMVAGPYVFDAIRKHWPQATPKPEQVDSDLKPSDAVMVYLDSILSVPATPQQQVEALKGGKSRAEFMADLLSKGNA